MARTELVLALRRGEGLLVTMVIPLGILVFFATLDILPALGGKPVDFLAPGVIALAVISSAMVALGIATGFERQQGVLKRLGATPLGREGLFASKLLTVVVTLAVQIAAIALTALALGWRPSPTPAAAGIVALGACAFAGIGLSLAGRLRAETNLAAANGGFLVMLLLGGVVAPVERLPVALQTVARVLPAEPLATGLRAALGGGPIGSRVLWTLTAWAVAATLVAVRTFRWEP
ncbi:MAG TPA: ABC transporter permease [Actinomycetota bacterium]|nr:ABC transporter permease [Actinomycetota bacterium]